MSRFKRWLAPDGLDDLFIARYPKLVSWARQLVGRDLATAEGLVHDTFVRLALRNPDLSAIEDPDAYLYVTMRNVHLSEVRRRGPRVAATLSLVDYDSVQTSLIAAQGARIRQAAYEELGLIARYACQRKSTSRAASALILRFFHGYTPAETARLLHTTEAAVDTRLRMARAEARTFIADPNRHGRSDETKVGRRSFGWVPDEANVVTFLRQRIFDAREGACPGPGRFDDLYAEPSKEPLDARTLAHLVCCRTCLDTLNQRFGLPLLRDRDPLDTAGRNPRSGGPRGEK